MDQEQRARDLLAQAQQRAAAGDPKAQAVIQKLQAIIQKLEQKRLTAFNADGSSNLSYDDMLGADRPKANNSNPSSMPSGQELGRASLTQMLPLAAQVLFDPKTQRFAKAFLNTGPNTINSAAPITTAYDAAFDPRIGGMTAGQEFGVLPDQDKLNEAYTPYAKRNQELNNNGIVPTFKVSPAKDIGDTIMDVGGNLAGYIVGPGKIIPGQNGFGPVNLLNLAKRIPGQVARNVADAALYFGINRPEAEPGQARQSVGEAAVEGATNPFNLVSAAAIRAAGRAGKAVLEAPQSVNAAGRTLTTGQPANALFNMPEVLNYTRPPEALKPKTPLVFRKADQLTGAMVGGSIGGSGPADAQTSNNNQGGPNVTDAGIGAAVGYFLPRSMRNAVERVWSAGKGSDRVALSKILSELKAAGIKDEQEFMSLYRAMYGDKPATPADIVSSLRGMVTGAARLPGKTGDIATARKLELSDGALNRRMDDVTGGLGIDANNVQGGLEAMKIAARQAANPVYEQLYKDFTNLSSPELVALMNNNRVKKFAREVNDYRDAMMLRGRPIGDMEYMDKLKQEFDTQIRLLRDRGMREGDIELQTLETLRGRLVNELDRLTTTGAGDAAQSAYRQAREVGGQAPQMDAAFAEGRKVFNQNMSTEQLRAMMQEITGLNLNAAQLGLVSKFVEKAENTQGALQSMLTPAAERKLTEVFGAEKAQKFKARIEAEIALNNSASRMAPGQGSVTSEAQGGVAGLVDLFTKATDAVKNPVEAGLAYLSSSGAMNRAQRDAFGQRALEPITEQSAREIYSGAGRGNRTTAIPPRTAAAAAAAAAATAAGTGSAGAQEDLTPAIQSTQSDIETARADIETAKQEIAAIKARIRDFRAISDPIKLQEFLKNAGKYAGKIEGNTGPATTAGINSWIADRDEEIKRAEADRGLAEKAMAKAEGNLKELNRRKALQNNPDNPLLNAVRDYAPTALAVAAGAGVKFGLRPAMVKGSVKAASKAEAQLNKTLTSVKREPVTRIFNKADQSRPANLNEFWRRGGAKPDEEPFIKDTQGRYKANKNAAPVGSLYQKQGFSKFLEYLGSKVNGADLALMASMGGEVALVQPFVQNAEKNLAFAEENFKENPSDESYKAVETAKNDLMMWNTIQRTGIGIAGGVAAAGAFGKRYAVPRPNLPGAETEQVAIQQYLKATRPQPKPRAPRQPQTVATPPVNPLLPTGPQQPQKPKP